METSGRTAPSQLPNWTHSLKTNTQSEHGLQNHFHLLFMNIHLLRNECCVNIWFSLQDEYPQGNSPCNLSELCPQVVGQPLIHSAPV